MKFLWDLSVVPRKLNGKNVIFVFSIRNITKNCCTTHPLVIDGRAFLFQEFMLFQ